MAHRRHFFLWDILTPVRRCLWCGSTDVHPSTHPLRLLTVFRWKTWRCHRCERRFPLRPGQGGTPPEFVEAVRRQPAGEALRPLDDALADVLKPLPPEEAGTEALKPARPTEPSPPTRRADDQS